MHCVVSLRLAHAEIIAMGITTSYRRISSDELAKLLCDPEWALSFLGLTSSDMDVFFEDQMALMDSPAYLDIDKDGPAIHFLLTGDASMDAVHQPQKPLHNIVFGGT